MFLARQLNYREFRLAIKTFLFKHTKNSTLSVVNKDVALLQNSLLECSVTRYL